MDPARENVVKNASLAKKNVSGIAFIKNAPKNVGQNVTDHCVKSNVAKLCNVDTNVVDIVESCVSVSSAPRPPLLLNK